MSKVLYEIVIRGRVGESVITDLAGFRVIKVCGGETTLRGWIVDQSGLHGVLDRLSGFGLELTSVAPVED
jgi:hypothetical protein